MYVGSSFSNVYFVTEIENSCIFVQVSTNESIFLNLKMGSIPRNHIQLSTSTKFTKYVDKEVQDTVRRDESVTK